MPAVRWADALANYGATAGFIAFSLWFYTSGSPFHRGFLDATMALHSAGGVVTLRTPDLLTWIALSYAVALLPYYALLPEITSKARIALAYLGGQFFAAQRPRFGRNEQQAFLALFLKFFFVPLMLNWLLGSAGEVLGHWHALAASPAGRDLFATFNAHLYLFAFKSLLVVDVFLFTVGYVVEIPRLDNMIRSVDPTASGWLVCLLCYPPFNQAFTAFFPWQAADFPKFQEPAVHVILNCMLLASMAIYASGSVALGLRASNLTNRGIVARGPYAWVRHPAYAAKNLAWWIGALPAFAMAFGQSFGAGVWAVGSMAAWTAVYVLRALTEERHLLMLDNGYAQYMKTVRYRFVPKVC
jgi:protein-S-isoprenylcysteine O-methyltransferase Ste14